MLARLAVLALVACVQTPGAVRHAPRGTDSDSAEVDSADSSDTGDSAVPAPCPADMVLVGESCIDRYEAPNQAGLPPLVMYTLIEAGTWCEARGKRLCRDDEWLAACAGPDGWDYPYGDVREPGRCNDEETWRVYDQDLLNGWPASASAADVDSLDDLFERAAATGTPGKAAADHVASLYQGEGGGDNEGCGGTYGVYDLQGNAEEWVIRADGGEPSFHGALVGRYWAESRTCGSHVTVHGDGFRFYEIGFRCCSEPLE